MVLKFCWEHLQYLKDSFTVWKFWIHLFLKKEVNSIRQLDLIRQWFIKIILLKALKKCWDQVDFPVQKIAKLLLHAVFTLRIFKEVPDLYSSCLHILIEDVTFRILLLSKLCLLEQDFNRVFKTQVLAPTFPLHVYVSTSQFPTLIVLPSLST